MDLDHIIALINNINTKSFECRQTIEEIQQKLEIAEKKHSSIECILILNELYTAYHDAKQSQVSLSCHHNNVKILLKKDKINNELLEEHQKGYQVAQNRIRQIQLKQENIKKDIQKFESQRNQEIKELKERETAISA